MSHLASMTLFALLVSIAFAAIGQRALAARITRAICSFALFMLIAIGLAWLLFPLSR
ncbi:MAG TPA: hypothetical protein VJN69_02095 [Candidatus Acidoferrales bacterium]|nr:hypothetical protein [Candidatus Acidoferrales bacterium]